MLQSKLSPGENNYNPELNVILSSGKVDLDGAKMIFTIKGKNLHPSINFYDGLKINGAEIEYGMLYQPEKFTSEQIQYVYQFNDRWAGKTLTLTPEKNSHIIKNSINLTIPSNWKLQTFQDGNYQFSLDGTITKYIPNISKTTTKPEKIEINIPDFLTTPDGKKVVVKNLGFQSFFRLKPKPTKITLPKSLETIFPEALALNTNLEEVVWGDKIHSIGSYFLQTSKVNLVKLPTSVQFIDMFAFKNSNVKTAHLAKTTLFFKSEETLSALNSSFDPTTDIIIY